MVLTIATRAGAQWVKADGVRDNGVSAIAVCANYVFAATDSGVFRYSGSGSSWEKVGTGIEDAMPSALITEGDRLFLGSFSGGVFISSDYGVTWTPSGLDDSCIMSLTKLDIGILATTCAGYYFLSTDDGASWSSPALPRIEASIGNELFACGDSDVLESSDSGRSWNEVTLPMKSKVNCAFAIESNLFVETEAGLLLSTDKGRTWKMIDGDARGLQFMRAAKSGARIVLGTMHDEIMLSTDKGLSWSKIHVGFSSDEGSAVGIRGSDIFVGTALGEIYHSTDLGSTWVNDVNQGLEGLWVLSLVTSDSNVYAGTLSSSVFRSTDDGNIWTVIDSVGHTFSNSALAVDGPILFAGIGEEGRLQFSSNEGKSWSNINIAQTHLPVSAVVAEGSAIYAATRGNGVFYSSNKGKSWISIDHGLPPSADVTALAKFGTILLAGTCGSGVFRSSNDGHTWRSVSNGLTNDTITAFAKIGEKFFVATYGGIFHSSNNGTTWVDDGLPSTSSVSALTVYGSDLFVGTWGDGVFLSSDFGLSWKPVSEGLQWLCDRRIRSMTANTYYLFIGTCSSICRRPLAEMVGPSSSH